MLVHASSILVTFSISSRCCFVALSISTNSLPDIIVLSEDVFPLLLLDAFDRAGVEAAGGLEKPK